MCNIANTLFIGKVFLHFEALDSTNSKAIELLAKSNPSEGTVISAAFQHNGRGQFGSNWYSQAAQNITLSIIFYPKFLAPNQSFLLTQCISLGGWQFLQQYISHQSIAIKWPNDLYVGKRKISGMLIQNSVAAKQLTYSVVGIGLNVNQINFSPNSGTPVSLAQLNGQSYELNDLIPEFCRHIEFWYLKLREGQFALIRSTYQEKLYQLMEDAIYQRPDGATFEGRIVGVTAGGKLIVHHSEGEELFNFKEISYL